MNNLIVFVAGCRRNVTFLIPHCSVPLPYSLEREIFLRAHGDQRAEKNPMEGGLREGSEMCR